MTKNWYCIYILLVLSACRQPALKPRLAVEKDSINIGTVPFLDSTGITYHLSNEGGKPLIIKNVGTSCGCSQAYYSDSIIAPGKKTMLHVGFKATDTGWIAKHIVIETNADPIYKTLVFTGYVKKAEAPVAKQD